MSYLSFSANTVLLDGDTTVDTFPDGSQLTLRLCDSLGSCCSESFTGIIPKGAYWFTGGEDHACRSILWDWRAFQRGDTPIEMELTGTDLELKCPQMNIKLLGVAHNIACKFIKVQGNGGMKRLDKEKCTIKMRV